MRTNEARGRGACVCFVCDCACVRVARIAKIISSILFVALLRAFSSACTNLFPSIFILKNI